MSLQFETLVKSIMDTTSDKSLGVKTYKYQADKITRFS